MIVKVNPEFGIELALAVPYAYHLHKEGKLEGVVTSKGMSPYYYFCDNVKEEFQSRTINNKLAGLETLPNDWIHGINSLEEPGVLDYNEWEVPNYSEHFKNDEYNFDRPTIFINNKLNLEHGETPYGFFDIETLNTLFIILNAKGYNVVYKRAAMNQKGFTIDENEINSIRAGIKDIQADVKGVGVITDYQLCDYHENVTWLDNIVKENYNESQLKVMANCEGFITVCGGNSILCSMFQKPTISYVHKGKELRRNYFGPDSYFQKLSNNNVFPAIDVIGHINTETYGHPVNNTGKNDFTGLFNIVEDKF